MSDTSDQQAIERPASTADVAAEQRPPEQQQQGTAEVARQLEAGGGDEGGTLRQADEAPLFPPDEAGQLQDRWQEVQASFVDEPRQAVQQADELVAGAIKRLAQTFADERSQLEGQWDRGDEVSTEDLRVALQKYRSFFGRLLKV
ncbi:MAG: hypothetical protein LC648_05330 [Novosphingobium sp.]|nr:hypothetical protein [Novosphingobium sp.]